MNPPLPTEGTRLPSLDPTPARDAALRSRLRERRRRLAALPSIRERKDLQVLLEEVDAALARVDAGSYGLCDACHDPIEAERLVDDPLIRICLGCLTEEQARALERDLETASAIQMGLLPPRHLCVVGWDVGYRYHPAGTVSGDYCDVIPANGPNEVSHFMLGDVAGKGVAASLLMSNLQAIFRSLVPRGLPLPQLVEQANHLFCDSTRPNAYATIVVGRLQPTGSLQIVNAGHPAPLVSRDGTVHDLAATGLPLGLFRDARFETHHVDLSDGDLLFLYTDGVSETRDAQEELYGSRRLASVLVTAERRGVEPVLRSCLDDLAAFRHGTSQEDDVTMLAVRRAVA